MRVTVEAIGGPMRKGRWEWIALSLLATGCATLQQVAALRHVTFDLAQVSNGRLAGIDLSRVRSYSSLTVADAVRLGAAVARNDVPLELTLDVRAENPATNRVSARMTRLQWALYLQDRETISGSVDQAVELPPGDPRTIPVTVRVNLLQFFDGPAQTMVDLALTVLGQDAGPTTVSLKAVPSIDTPLGPLSYPTPITIARRTVR